jgi:hypothetical protein
VSRSQRYDLITATVQKVVADRENPTNATFGQESERSVQLLCVAGLHDQQRVTFRSRSTLGTFYLGTTVRHLGIYYHADRRPRWDQLVEQLDPLGMQLRCVEAHTSYIAAWPA